MSSFIRSLWDMMFGLQDPIGLSVNLVIAVLLVMGCLDVIYSLIRLSRERLLINQARKKLGDTRSRCPSSPASAVLKFLGLAEPSLTGRRVARVLKLRSSGLGQREVLQQLSADRVEGYGALARYLGVTLTLLGLLGTVFGLSLALLKIQGALEGVNNVEGLGELTRALGGTLQGMKTAFGCTLAGLMSAIFLSFLNHRTRRAQSAVIANLEEFIVCDLLPALETTDPGADEAAKALANTMKAAGADLDQVRLSVTAAAEQFQTGSNTLATVSESMKQTVQSLSTSMTQIAGNQQSFIQSLAEVKGSLVAMTDSIGKQFKDVQEYTANCNRLLEARLEAMETTTEVNQNVLEALQTIAEQFNPAIREYHAHFKGFLNETQTEFAASLKNLLIEINNYYKEGVAGHIDRSQQVFQESLGQHLAKLQTLADQNRSMIASLLDQHQQAVSTFSDLAVDLNNSVRSLFDGLEPINNGRARHLAASLPKEMARDGQSL